ncbi:hypothetical protein KP509_25G029500 [Ceratopteris richardii]|uniref:Uncharacterized protein n=1 Tax=Ceratopteris richardii TaxID=49495 RepID=A0A8T2RRT3_CERRI|nr:hypothetical protein KP509_25G029500 [Ceratopteris richardii]
MASTSGVSAGGPSSTAMASAPHSVDPPPLSSTFSSSKRRWSPCTWRYAIEEVQPELGSRPRSGSGSASSVTHLVASPCAGPEQGPAPLTSGKPRPYHSHDHLSAKEVEEHGRRSAYGRGASGGVEPSDLRARHAQPRPLEPPSKKKCRTQQLQVSHPEPHLSKEVKKWPKEEHDDDKYGVGYCEEDQGVEHRHRLRLNSKRKKRELSPTEIYFCEICRARAAAKSAKMNISVDSQLPSQDP